MMDTRRCHILILSKPGSEKRISEIFEAEIKGEMASFLGEMIQVYGPYDVIITFKFSDFNDVGKCVLSVRGKLKDHITETVTCIER